MNGKTVNPLKHGKNATRLLVCFEVSAEAKLERNTLPTDNVQHRKLATSMLELLSWGGGLIFIKKNSSCHIKRLEENIGKTFST